MTRNAEHISRAFLANVAGKLVDNGQLRAAADILRQLTARSEHYLPSAGSRAISDRATRSTWYAEHSSTN